MVNEFYLTVSTERMAMAFEQAYKVITTRKIIVFLLSFSFLGALIGSHEHASSYWMNFVLLVLLCFFCELIDSSLGMGYGTILTPLLMFLGYDIREVVPCILLSELLSGFTASFFHQRFKNVNFFQSLYGKTAMILSIGSVLGVCIGSAVSFSLPKQFLTLGVGIIIFSSGMFILVFAQRGLIYSYWKIIVIATIASFNKALSGGGYGPLVTSGQILSGVTSKASVSIASLAEAFTCLFAIGIFFIAGGSLSLSLFIPMSIGALLSTPCAAHIVKKSDEQNFKLLVGLATTVLGVLTLVKAITAIITG